MDTGVIPTQAFWIMLLQVWVCRYQLEPLLLVFWLHSQSGIAVLHSNSVKLFEKPLCHSHSCTVSHPSGYALGPQASQAPHLLLDV